MLADSFAGHDDGMTYLDDLLPTKD